jgi:BirA family biotin operon repressor/biotin-[acetyl-CoA-carboxylase] ligase
MAPDMLIYTDSVAFAERLVPTGAGPWTPAAEAGDAGLRSLLTQVFADRTVHVAAATAHGAWPLLLATETGVGSQFDRLVQLSRTGIDLPDGTLCVVGAGRGLHGQRGRAWTALAGNLHLSIWLAPPPDAVRSPIDLLVMAAVSVVQAIDDVPGLAGRAGIKWVNDILLDGAKVCGILTHVAHRPGGLVGIVGVGLNVEVVPDLPPTPFVPAVTALLVAAAAPERCRLGPVLHVLLAALDRNYSALRSGGSDALITRYRDRSVVVGRQVALCGEGGGTSPEIIAEGRVTGLGDRVELFLEGHSRPFTTGRLLLRP